MSQVLLLDTGPLVALLSARDRYHPWARQAFARVASPMLTCEPVLSEACYLLRDSRDGQSALLQLLERRMLVVDFVLMPELASVRRLINRYRDQPMSLADACLVRMAELFDDSKVMTLDSDYVVYRKNGRQVIGLIAPFA